MLILALASKHGFLVIWGGGGLLYKDGKVGKVARNNTLCYTPIFLPSPFMLMQQVIWILDPL